MNKVVTRTTLAASSQDPEYWLSRSPEERLAAVWELTLQCLAWQGSGADEPRLQRSVVRIQRARR